MNRSSNISYQYATYINICLMCLLAQSYMQSSILFTFLFVRTYVIKLQTTEKLADKKLEHHV